jgi:hypothetical protein
MEMNLEYINKFQWLLDAFYWSFTAILQKCSVQLSIVRYPLFHIIVHRIMESLNLLYGRLSLCDPEVNASQLLSRLSLTIKKLLPMSSGFTDVASFSVSICLRDIDIK